MKKHLLYANYLLRHKWFVFQAGRKIGVNWFRLLKHDFSKFLPSEWIPYTNFFYGAYPPWSEVSDGQKGAGYPFELSLEYWTNKFAFAWNLHQKRNKHHWQAWVLLNDSGSVEALEMPTKYIYEMVADWAGAGRAITGQWEVGKWYRDNEHKMRLNQYTKIQVEAILREHFDLPEIMLY